MSLAEETDPGTLEADAGTVHAENVTNVSPEDVQGGYAAENMNSTAELDTSHNVTSHSENTIETGQFEKGKG